MPSTPLRILLHLVNILILLALPFLLEPPYSVLY
jgi:hypothetical protein